MIRIVTLAAGMLVIGGVSALVSTLCRSRCCPTTATIRTAVSRGKRRRRVPAPHRAHSGSHAPQAPFERRSNREDAPALTHEAACGRRLNGPGGSPECVVRFATAGCP